MLDKENPPFKKISGVSQKIYNEYKFDSHLWYSGISNEGIADSFSQVGRDLAKFIIMVDGTYWIKDPVSGTWSSYKDTVAKREAKNKFLGVRVYPSNHTIDNDDINTYFSGVLKVWLEEQKEEISYQVGSCPSLNGTISIPFAPQYIEYKTNSFLNTWKDTSVVGNEAYRTQGLAVLRMLYRSLCAADELDEDPIRESEMLLEQVQTNTYTNETFRFVLNWFAAIYQRPGINLLTNIWFVSTLEGIGKSLFVDINARTIGYDNFFRMQPQEIERGWTDCLVGKQLIEFDEFPRTRKFDWPSWIKRTTIATELMVSGRGKTQTNIINVGNYVFSLNPRKDGDIIEMGSSDRRNVFIQGTDDEKWKAYSTGIATRFTQDWQPFAEGWAWVLEQVKLDLKLVNSNHTTALKKEMIEDAVSEDIILSWLQNDATLAHDLRYTATDFWQKYVDWVKIYSPAHSGNNLMSLTKFCTRVKKYPGVHNIKPQNKSYYVIQPVPVVDRVATVEAGRSEIESIFADGVESEAIVVEPVIVEPSKLEQMREHLRRERDEFGHDEPEYTPVSTPVRDVVAPEKATVDVQSILDQVRGQGKANHSPTPNAPNSSGDQMRDQMRERMEKNEKLRKFNSDIRDLG